MLSLPEWLHTVIALLRSGPWGHPIVTHHHLHKG